MATAGLSRSGRPKEAGTSFSLLSVTPIHPTDRQNLIPFSCPRAHEQWENKRAVSEKRPSKRRPAEDREVDYLICRQCSTPCYIFEMENGSLKEAQCLVCGNDEVLLFTLGDEPGSDDS